MNTNLNLLTFEPIAIPNDNNIMNNAVMWILVCKIDDCPTKRLTGEKCKF